MKGIDKPASKEGKGCWQSQSPKGKTHRSNLWPGTALTKSQGRKKGRRKNFAHPVKRVSARIVCQKGMKEWRVMELVLITIAITTITTITTIKGYNCYNYCKRGTTATTIATTTITTIKTITISTTLQLQPQPQLQPQLQIPHYNFNNINPTTTITTALHHTTSRSCEWGDHCNHCNHSKKHNSNHPSVHQGIRSAIHASQQLTSPIASYPWNFPHRLARYYR